MTDYGKWSKFDVDKALEEQDEIEKVKDTTQEKRIQVAKEATQVHGLIDSCRREAEILESKSAVEALKAARTRRRGNTSKPTSEVSPSVTSLPSTETCTPERVLLKLTEFLMGLAAEVDKLQGYTERHFEHMIGLVTAVHCVEDIASLQRIENLILLLPNTALVTALKDIRSSEAFLLRQSTSCLALFALSAGWFSVSADCARAVLRDQGDEADAGMWILRGVAFAGMGSAHLCHLHFRTALSKNSLYPGLKAAMQVAERAEAQEAETMSQWSFVERVQHEWKRCLHFSLHRRSEFLSKFSDLASVEVSDLEAILHVEGLQPTHREQALKPTESLHLEESASENSETQRPAIEPQTMLQSMESNLIAVTRSQLDRRLWTPVRSFLASKWDQRGAIALALLHRVFSEAQLLFLEGLFRSAEVKYTVAVLLGDEVLNSATTLETASNVCGGGCRQDSLAQSVRAIVGTALGNIVSCRIHRQRVQGVSAALQTMFAQSTSWEHRALQLDRASALAVCTLAQQYLDCPMIRYREVEVLELLYRYVDASSVLLQVEANLSRGSESCRCIASYGSEPVLFSQRYLFGCGWLLTQPADDDQSPTNATATSVQDPLGELMSILQRRQQNHCTTSNADIHRPESWQVVINKKKARLEYLCQKFEQ